MSLEIQVFETERMAFFIMNYSEKLIYEFLQKANEFKIVPEMFFPFNIYDFDGNINNLVKDFFPERSENRYHNKFLFMVDKHQIEITKIENISHDEQIAKGKISLKKYNELLKHYKKNIILEENISKKLLEMLEENIKTIKEFEKRKFKYALKKQNLTKEDLITAERKFESFFNYKNIDEFIKNFPDSSLWLFLKYYTNTYKESYVKTPVHFENLYTALPFEKEGQIQILDSKTQEPILLNLSFPEQKAIFALQKILKKRSYNGDKKEPVKYTLEDPTLEIINNNLYSAQLRINLNEYYEAYGLNKNKKSGGKLYKEAKEALNSLLAKEFDFKLTFKAYDKKSKKTVKVQEVVRNMKLMYLIESEISIFEGNKRTSTRKNFYIKLSDIFTRDIIKYSLHLPEDVFEIISKNFTRDAESAMNILRYFYLKAFKLSYHDKTGEKTLIIKEDLERFAIRAKLEKYIKERKISNLKRSLRTKLEKFKRLGFINNYRISNDEVYIELNKKRFLS
ncbi:hypothetical protein Marpi_2128 (plasmid) [Marinitoga piezophila KA3]|uniref:Uncharacterized protein n=1 Tax=Marinitoga piezophila (strain DSM 14283 / JCM 11233 / KA3) TaxID=443254 RepID=H2J8F7_MARPK|nr:hypothetical protein [Marinitoga piezophila]AEX86501.1 hypothetical protein Marpi_2128 [Marinitoga piezophila KA3]